MTTVVAELVADSVEFHVVDANVSWNLTCVTWPGAALAAPAEASKVSVVIPSAISSRLIAIVPSQREVAVTFTATFLLSFSPPPGATSFAERLG
jgi:hypothetical protein